ncbi:hypothetical protein [Bacteroides sp. 519]|uniref:hypothetical protein n=1 Tax=Bacteroides sp. 519 TaxID=2302937 RepID=UPI0013D385C9|nr:hypothetical protein [Bacteroides sp. 519]NDV60037.1 hypothetical protein [Bacteroides sp. 519]
MNKIRLRKFIPDFLLTSLKEIETKRDFNKWVKAGKPIPPVHAAKRMMIREYQQKNNSKILVETGTYTGEMVFVQMPYFSEIYSIELSNYYYKKAVKRFKRYSQIHLYHGDSALMLKEVVSKLDTAAIFWLDGHYSGGLTAKGELECPIFAEIDAVVSSPQKHVMLIDDAHCFVGENDYPTVDELKTYFDNSRRNYTFNVRNNIIIIELLNN